MAVDQVKSSVKIYSLIDCAIIKCTTIAFLGTNDSQFLSFLSQLSIFTLLYIPTIYLYFTLNTDIYYFLLLGLCRSVILRFPVKRVHYLQFYTYPGPLNLHIESRDNRKNAPATLLHTDLNRLLFRCQALSNEVQNETQVWINGHRI